MAKSKEEIKKKIILMKRRRKYSSGKKEIDYGIYCLEWVLSDGKE